MPHIIIEHSQNAELTQPAAKVLETLHSKLASFPTIEFSGIKSRIIKHEDFRLADGATDAAFVHVQLALMTGRDVALRQEIGRGLMELLPELFRHVRAGSEVRLSVEVREMLRETYFYKTSSAGG
jgi:5-carboxymethyl-2-hydroxymuconate isomerase